MLVSFYILAYNHAKLIEAAIDGALAQTYTPLEIIISDDCSTDHTWDIINHKIKLYSGPHKIIIRRNLHNIGISAHINEVWNCCTGEWIIASAGDDISNPDRVAKIVESVQNNPDVKLIQSYLNEIDEDGHLINVNQLGVDASDHQGIFFTCSDRIKGSTYHPHGAAMAYSRDIFDVFGKLPDGVIFEDNIVNVRSELIGLAMVLPIPLVNHRNHAGQITRINLADGTEVHRRTIQRRLDSDVISTQQNIDDIRTVQDRILQSIYNKLSSYYIDRLCYFKCKRKALLMHWPIRLFYCIKIIWRGNKVAPFSKSDVFCSLLPGFFFRFIKNIKLNIVRKKF